MSRMILGFNSQRQRLDSAHVERGDLLDVTLLHLDALFLSFETSEVEAIGAIHPIDQGQYQQRGLPSSAPVNDSDQSDGGRANQVVGKRPEVAFRPNFPARLSFGQGDHER